MLCLGAASLILHGCGGGGSGSATDDLAVTVIDGAIQNATVCLDKNLNGTCDLGEPSGTTDAAGKVILKVDKADAGKFPVLAVVPVGAIDADSGPVATAFTMKAPADKTAIVSPLTTLVQTLIEGSGLSSAAAEVELKAQSGLVLSLFDDFTNGSSVDHQTAGALARLVVVTTQQQTAALVGTIGTQAIDGSTITQEKLNKAVQLRLLERLPTMAAAVPTVLAAASGAAREAAVSAEAGVLVAGNELTTGTIGTVVAVNNPAPASSTTTTLQQVQALASLLDAAYAANTLDLDVINDAFVDKCSIDSGYTRQTGKAYREANPALSALYNRYRSGSTRTNVEVLAERSSTNPDGSSRREVDVKYKVMYTDGTSTDPSTEGVGTLISGSSQGSVFGPGRTCSVPQVGSNLRFFGNRRIVDVRVRPWNTRNERHNLATGAALASAVDYSKYVQFRFTDPSNFAKYLVVTGLGLPTAGLKLLSPRIQRDATLFAGKRGNFVDWKDDDTFRFCRNSGGGSSDASTVDCNANGASGTGYGAFNVSPSQADLSFDAIGFVSGGVYTVRVYDDDGWIGVNGHASRTPIATYTTTLRSLPYNAVALAGSGVDNDLYPRMITSLSKAEIATAFNTKTAFTTNVNFTALGILPDATMFGFGEISAYTEGDAAGVASTPYGWPRSRQRELGVAVPALGASSVTGFSVSAATSVLVTPRYAEVFLSLNNRRGVFIGSSLSFETVVP